MLAHPGGPVGLQTPNNHNALSQIPSYQLLTGLVSDSRGGPHGRVESCIAGRGCGRQLHWCGALPMHDLPCPVLCGDLPLTAEPLSPWRWEARHSERILPEALGRSSPSLRWDTSSHWEEELSTGAWGTLLEQGWEREKRHGARGTRGEQEQGRHLAGLAGGTELDPARQRHRFRAVWKWGRRETF